MRHIPASSIGPEYRTVWHYAPDGTLTFITDRRPEHTYARYFAPGDSALTLCADIASKWDGPHSLRVTVPDMLDWRIELGSTPATVMMTALSLRLPPIAWRSNAFQRVVNAVAAALLRAGRVGMSGTAPNGQRFAWGPRRIWTIARSTPFFTAWISARHIRYPDNYTSSISGYPNAAFSRSVTPRSRTSTPPNMRCHRHRRSNHKQEGKIHDHTAHPCRQRRKRRRAARRPLGVARYTGTRSVQMVDNGFVDRRHSQLVHRLTRSMASASRSSTRRSSPMTSIIRWPSPPKTTAPPRSNTCWSPSAAA